jgi:hypothetical protein
MSWTDAFRNADNQADASICRLEAARSVRVQRSHGAAGGYGYFDQSGPNFSIQRPLAAFAGRHTRDYIGSICDHLGSVEEPFVTRDPLHQQACVFIN